MPLQLLGVVASGVEVASTSFESIATVTVGSGGSSSISFTSIPGTYAHLQLRYLVKASGSSESYDFLQMTVNGSTPSARQHYLTGNGTAASADNGNLSAAVLSPYPNGNGPASTYGIGVVDILDYANTNKARVTRTLGGWDQNGSGQVRLVSSWIDTTSAITSIELKSTNNNTLAQYSHFALYGIRSA